MPPEKKLSVRDLTLGSTSIAARRDGGADPAGVVHLVEGWLPACGGPRVRFLFPGRPVELADACPDCAATVAPVPRQRQATARSSSPRSRRTAPVRELTSTT
jgi:hypothetical protein